MDSGLSMIVLSTNQGAYLIIYVSLGQFFLASLWKHVLWPLKVTISLRQFQRWSQLLNFYKEYQKKLFYKYILGVMGTHPYFPTIFQRKTSFVTSCWLPWTTNPFQNGVYAYIFLHIPLSFRADPYWEGRQKRKSQRCLFSGIQIFVIGSVVLLCYHYISWCA